MFSLRRLERHRDEPRLAGPPHRPPETPCRKSNVDEHPKAWRYASIVHIDGFELGEGWVRLAMWLTSASPGGFHDWKTLYQDRHRFYMWLHTYIVEANLVYCSPTVPLLEIKDNAAEIYKKRQ